MWQLRLFGTPSIDRDGSPLSGRAAQRHRVALLALLAQAPSRRLTRDKLIAHLWPERDPERGRNLLKVSTYVLREALGEGALLSDGDQLRLDTESIAVDTVAFEAAMARADHASAVLLYRGPFLDGFFLSDTPEFEQWVDRERQRLAGLQGRALESLAERAEKDGDLPQAVEWWTARAAHDPFDSRIALRLVRALDASGNRAGALQHASAHQQYLKEELGVAPPSAFRSAAERLRRQSFEAPVPTPRPIAPASQASPERPSPLAADPPPSRPSGRRPTTPIDASKHTGRWRAAAVLLAALFIGGAVWSAYPRGVDPEPSIVVLPFVDLRVGTKDDYFSDGLTEEIIGRLAAVPGLKVISRTSAMHYRGSAKPLRTIAGELKVAHALEGSVRQHDGHVRISAQLIDTRTDAHLWSASYEYPLQASIRVQEEIAQGVARALAVKVGERERSLLARQTTRDPDAYELYRRGRYVWRLRTKDGNERAIDFYRRAIERDSSFADAYAGLADAYLVAYQHGFMPEADASSRHRMAAERAIGLDDRSAEAHTSFAVALWWQRNWLGADRELRRAIELNPGNVPARGWHSLLLAGMGRTAEALAEGRRAVELDPLSAAVIDTYGFQCYIARDLECAVAQHSLAIELGEYPQAYSGLGLAYALLGRYAESMHAIRKAIELVPAHTEFLANLAFVQAMAGEREAARATLHRAKAAPFEGFHIARAYIALQEPDSAFAWLERSSWRWPHRANRSDPALDPLRSDPRFARLSARVEREMGLR